MTRSRLIFFCVILIAALVVLVLRNPRQDYFDEKVAFRLLSSEASEFIDKGGAGIGEANGTRFIRSPRMFFEQVRQKNPSLVSSFEAENCFPGIMPDGKYRWGGEATTQPTDVVFYSLQKYEGGEVQMAIAADGTFREEKDRDNGVSYRTVN